MGLKSSFAAKGTRPLLREVVPRPRLFRWLDRCGDRPLTWVHGPPGAGKTTLLASYVEARRSRALWYGLHEGDADVATFFYFFGSAAAKVAAGRRRPLPLLTPEYLGGISTFARRYFAELFRRLRPPFLVVLDDYHEVSAASPLHEVVREAIGQLPSGCRLVIASRAAPPAALARLRASGAMSSLSGEELRLTPGEARAIARERGAAPRLAHALQEMAQGWAAGLVLLLEQRDGVDRSTDRGPASPQALFDYFAGEIFDKTDREAQDVLLRTAFLPRATARMAEALTRSPRAAAVLEGLARANYFTTTRHAQGDRFYEYHPLFRRFLLAKAEQFWTAEQRRRVQRDAGLLLESGGYVEDAIALLTEAGDWPAVVRIVTANAEHLLAHGRAQTLQAWLQSLPPEQLEHTPWLRYWLGASQLAMNPLAARENFSAAFAGFEEANEPAGLLLAWAGIVDTFVYAWDDFTPLDRWIETLQRRLAIEPDFPSPDIEGRIVFGMFTALMYRQPHHPDLPSWADRAMECALGSPHAQVRMMIAHQLLLYYNWWTGELGKATVLVDTLRPLSRAPDVDPLARIVWRSIEATYHWMTASHRASLEAAAEGLAMARETGIHLWDFMLCAQGVWGSLVAGNLPSAIEYLERMAQARNPAHGMHVTLYHDTAGILSVWRSDLHGALEHGRMALDRAIRTGMPFAQAMCNLTTAHALFGLGDAREAWKHLARAREIGRSIRGHYIEYLCLFSDAAATLDRGDEAAGLMLLRSAMALGRERGFWTHMWIPQATLARLCATALQHGIEVDYVRELIRRRGLHPDGSHLAADAWPWPVRITTLGEFGVVIDDEPLRFNGKAQKKPLALLKAILSLGGRGVREELLMDALWPDADGDAAARALTTTLHRLRRLLGHDALSRQEGRLGIETQRCWVDVWAVEECLDKAGACERASERDELLRRAAALCRGSFLAGEMEPWAAPMRERIRNRFQGLAALRSH